MSTNTPAPVQATIKRERPFRDGLGSIASGVARVTPEAVELTVSAVRSTRMGFDLIKLMMGQMLLEERMDMSIQLKQLAKEFNISKAELLAMAKGTDLDEMIQHLDF